MFKSLNDKAYKVGGCVRDKLLGLDPHDVDYVIEKTTPQQFREVFPCATGLDNCKDCKVKCSVPRVGESFPVYLVNGNEVALARTERKTGDKYQDFSVISGVSIEEDLARRDFTINSIAERYTDGAIVDPYGGAKDLKNGILCCVNMVAFTEDPLRIYRGARFATKFCLETHPDTLELMKIWAHDIVNVNPERVYVELKKVYESCKYPSIFFSYLHRIDALRYHFKPLHVLTKVTAGPVAYHHGKTAFEHSMDSFDYAKDHGYSFDVALAALFHDTGKGVTRKSILPKHYKHEEKSGLINAWFVKQHRFTAKQEQMIVNFGRDHMKFHLVDIMRPITLVRFWKSIKKYGDEYIQCANCDFPLVPEKLAMFDAVKRAFKEAKIEIPKGHGDPGLYAEEQYTIKLKEILNEGQCNTSAGSHRDSAP